MTMIEAVPRFGCVLLPYPPQLPVTSPKAIITATAVAVLVEAGAMRTFLACHIAKLSNASERKKALGRPPTPQFEGSRSEVIRVKGAPLKFGTASAYFCACRITLCGCGTGFLSSWSSLQETLQPFPGLVKLRF